MCLLSDAIGLIVAADLRSGNGGQQWGNCCNNANQNIALNHVTAENNGVVNLMFANASHITVLDTYLYDGDQAGTSGTANYNVEINDATFVNGLYNLTPWATQYGTDSSEFNLDNHMTNLRWRGDYLRSAAGSALEWTENPCFAGCTSSTNSGAEISSNAFSTNSTANNSSYYGDIDTTYSPQGTGTVQNNLYYDVPQTYNTFCHSCSPTYWTLTNNDSVISDGNLYDAPYQFSGTQGQNQWNYESQGSGSWANMGSYDSNAGQWSDTYGASISQFDMTPPSNNMQVGRFWTAPMAGTIQIRGWILKDVTGGNGVWAAIWSTHCGCTLWTSSLGANDQVGTATNADDVTVSQGDQIVFILTNNNSGNNTDDTTSWAPSIGYTSTSGSNLLQNPGFDSGSFSPWGVSGATSAAQVVNWSYRSPSYSAIEWSQNAYSAVDIYQGVSGRTPGSSFTASVWADSWTSGALLVVEDGNSHTLCSAGIANTGSWAQYSCSGTVGSDGQLYINFYMPAQGSGGLGAYWDDAVLTN